jgi:UDPglucose 6-dehydrogenase
MATKRTIAVVGLGYVGLANLAVFSEDKRWQLLAYDSDAEKIASLQKGEFPLREPAMNDVLKKNYKRIRYTTKKEDLAEADLFLLAVGTPSKEDGSADLSYLQAAILMIKSVLKKDVSILIRSTVPVGTGKAIREGFAGEKHKVCVISMPEFLSEGHSYEEEKDPYRFVVGCADKAGYELVRDLRKDAVKEGIPFYEMSNESAELTKYASNIFLSMKISYINEMARLSEKEDANIEDVAMAMGADPRIGHAMLHAGVGYGGSCFPKDGKALLADASSKETTLLLPEAAAAVNFTQPLYFLKKIKAKIPSLKDVKVALLGLTYKAGTADIRSSVSLVLAKYLLEEGAVIQAYDPSSLARKAFKAALPDVHMFGTLKEAVSGVEGLILMTEETEFTALDEKSLLSWVKGRFIFDGRNLYSLKYFKYFTYVSIGRKDVVPF